MKEHDRESAVPGNLTTGGELAQDFLSQVGANIRSLRTKRSLTVQQLADRSQISRRLLTQIELGQANPSLVAVTRIARQLGTKFTNLLDKPPAETPIEVHAAGDHRDLHVRSRRQRQMCIRDRFQGEPGEQWTMFFLDPSGNALEFKAFQDLSQLFAV